jgi:hypothetical protein
LAAGAGALGSHDSAGALWRFDGSEPPAEPDVLVEFGRHPRAGPGRVHRTRDLSPADVDRVGPIPVTSPSRTLCDLAPRLPACRLEAVLDHAERRGLIWRPHLRWRLDALRRCGRAGLPALADLLDRTDGRPLGDSWLEQEAIRLIVHAGLPVPRVQVSLRRGSGPSPHGSGKTIARVDLIWERERLVAEIAGQGTHATRRDRQHDAERASDLGLEGWRIATFVYEDVVERPAYVVDALRAHLGAAAA